MCILGVGFGLSELELSDDVMLEFRVILILSFAGVESVGVVDPVFGYCLTSLLIFGDVIFTF